MTVKEYLSRIGRIDLMIQNKLSEYYQIQTLVYSISSPIGGDKVQTSGGSDRMSSAVVKMVDIEKSLENLTAQRNKIVSEIETVEDADLYDVLAKRYILGMSNKEIAFEKQESERNIAILMQKGMEVFAEMYGFSVDFI